MIGTHKHSPPKFRRWESKGGKYWVELRHDKFGFSYKGHDCGGYLGTSPQTVNSFMDRLKAGEFQADANRTPMREVAGGLAATGDPDIHGGYNYRTQEWVTP